MATSRGSGAAAPSSAERLGLGLLLAAAGGVRWLAWERSATLFNDGPHFLAIARAMHAGAWAAALRAEYHPLFPLATLAAHAALPDWETAAAAVSIASGIAAVLFLFLWLRDAFGAAPAWAGSVLLAAHSRAIEYSSDVQSDGLYTALFLAALWLGWRALRGRSALLAAASGAVAALAYLVRPEGLELLVALGACAARELLRGPWISDSSRRWAAPAAARWLAALAAGAALLVVPYVVALRQQTGAWTLTPKRSVSAVMSAGAPRAAPAPPAEQQAPAPVWATYLTTPSVAAIDPSALVIDESEDGEAVIVARTPATRAYAAAKMLARTAKSSMRYGVLALVLLGALVSRGRPGPRARFLAVLLCVHLGLLYAFTLGIGYVSRRHTLPALLPLLGYAGLGALAAGGWIERRMRSLGAEAAPARVPAGLAATLVVALVAGGELTTQIEPRRAEERAGRRAAEWLRDNAPAPGPVATTRLRLGYYAGMPYVPLGGVGEAALGEYLTRAGARYAVVDDAGRAAALQRMPDLDARPLWRVEASGSQAWVFELGPPRAGREARVEH